MQIKFEYNVGNSMPCGSDLIELTYTSCNIFIYLCVRGPFQRAVAAGAADKAK